METPSKPPNIVVIVLDCVRAADFVGGNPGPGPMPFCDELKRESINFPRAVSTSSWSIPSHASIFTGLAPWETGCHWRGNLELAQEVPRVPELLAARGYRTMCLSVNQLLRPTFRLTQGFQQAAWGGWWEPHFRFATNKPPAQVPARGAPPKDPLPRRLAAGPLAGLNNRMRVSLEQHPVVVDVSSRIVQGLRSSDDEWNIAMGQWVEPTFADWVSKTPAETPVYSVINLLDAHNPYLWSRNPQRGEDSWWDYARLRQDAIGWIAGEWDPSPENFALLHRLYVDSIRSMDKRIQALVETLKRTGRWENTALFITGDHGQAFGEHGTMFHMLRVDEQLVRVPLWYRRPGGVGGGTSSSSWASIADIAPTALALGGVSPPAFPSSVDLESLVNQPRPSPVVAISDGIVWDHLRGRFDEERRRKYDCVWGAAYQGNSKVTVNIDTGQVSAFDIEKDPGEVKNLWPATDDSFPELERLARSAGQAVASASRAPLTAEIEERLRSWGYL
jgi:arylsulfatase A-like enzyme